MCREHDKHGTFFLEKRRNGNGMCRLLKGFNRKTGGRRLWIGVAKDKHNRLLPEK